MPASGSILRECLQASGLVLRAPPTACELREDTVIVIDAIKRNLQRHYDYPRNIDELLRDFREECKDVAVFRHYIFPKVNRVDEDGGARAISDSVVKILLGVSPLQDHLAKYVFEQAIDFAVEGACGIWIKTILQSFTTLDHIVSPEKMAENIINLLDVTIEKAVRLEIISAIPELVGDREHNNIASEMSRFLSEDADLTPAVLDCLSNLCLSDHHYLELQNKAIGILRTSVQFQYFPNFVKFLMMPRRADEVSLSDTVEGMRSALSWPTDLSEEICSSQILTASAIRSTITSSKAVASAWLKSVSSCQSAADHRPIDLVLLLILYTTSDDRQRQVDNLLRKHVKLNILKEHLIEEAFQNYKPIFSHYLQNLLDLVNNLLKLKSDNLVESFASHWYITMFTNLEDGRQTITANLLQHGPSFKQSMSGTLFILKNIADKDISMLKPQSLRMLALLDRLDDLILSEVREIMNLLCGLAFSFDNSMIRDDMQMIIKKQLESSNPAIKMKGILAAVQAVKYLMRNQEDGDRDVERSEDISYSSYSHLAEGDTREAAQVIELISRSTKQLPELFGFFYDELSEIVLSAPYVNVSFLSWLTDAVTNDLQQNFILNIIPTGKVCNMEVSMQYSLNEEEELECVIAMNIAELTLKKSKEECADISILPSLFQLVQILQAKKNDGDLGDIDALLGCPVILPKVDLDNCTEDMDQDQVFNILNCLIHCTNWFRELINGFATQSSVNLRQKIKHRIKHIEELERNINNILINITAPYKPPLSSVDVSKYIGDHRERKIMVKSFPSKTKPNKKAKLDDTNVPPTAKTQVSQALPGNLNIKSKLSAMEKLSLRKFNLNVLVLLDEDLSFGRDDSGALDISSFKFLLKYVNNNLASVMVSRIKKSTHLNKQQDNIYDIKRAELSANHIFNMLPKLMLHLEDINKHIGEMQENADDSDEYTSEFIDLQVSLEYLLTTFAIYFKWIEFRKQHNSLLKSSLRSVSNKTENPSNKVTSLRELIVVAAKKFQKLQDYCVLVPTAVSLIEVVKALSELIENETTLNIVKAMAYSFLSKQWKSPEGPLEKGLIFNQYVDVVMMTYFVNPEIVAIKTMAVQIKNEIQKLTGKNDHLDTMKSISRANFPILYRHLVGAVHDSAKNRLNKGLTDSQHLEMWKDIANILKTLSEIAKTLENRNNLSAFLKRSQPVFKLFISQGMPMMEIKLKTESQSVIEIFKELQYSTKFLQSLCCHSRLKKDNTLMAKVPQVRLLLEQFIYKVKAALAVNNCSEAFWMGNLINKNIQGEVITSQSTVTEENCEDSDEQLPEDNDVSEDDEDMLNPDSKSISDIISP